MPSVAALAAGFAAGFAGTAPLVLTGAAGSAALFGAAAAVGAAIASPIGISVVIAGNTMLQAARR